jgi:hypothetical protein
MSVWEEISTGAAADSAEEDRFKGLPRLLRYAILVSDNSALYVEQRLIAEIDELCPQLPHLAAWAAALNANAGLALAAELDHRAVTQNEPNLRSLSDCARLLCLPVPHDVRHFEDYRRVRSRPFGKSSVTEMNGSAAISSGSSSAGRRCRPSATYWRKNMGPRRTRPLWAL